MDYKEQQTQEIEALQAIYQEDFQVQCEEYPSISLRINLKGNQESENEDYGDFDTSLIIELPESYPDVIPRISVEISEDMFSSERIQETVETLEKVASENLGMVMVFTIVSAMQDEIGKLVELKISEAEQKAEAEKEKVEAIARKKFEGTLVTPESFKIWKENFDTERKALTMKQQAERDDALAGKLTGRELFLKDATLSLSDVALVEHSVEIDESLFDEELEGLDLDDSDED